MKTQQFFQLTTTCFSIEGKPHSFGRHFPHVNLVEAVVIEEVLNPGKNQIVLEYR